MTKQDTPFYIQVAGGSILAVAMGFILTYECIRELKADSFSDLFGIITLLGMAALGIFSVFLHVKFRYAWREMTSVNILGYDFAYTLSGANLTLRTIACRRLSHFYRLEYCVSSQC